MDRILLAVIRISVGFSLFFLTLYLIVSATQPNGDASAPMLSSGDVLWIGGMFVALGIIAQAVHSIITLVRQRRARESAATRLEEITGS